MKRLMAIACLLSVACGEGSGGSPTKPTPAPFPLPAGAPADAAAPEGTSRITITTVEIVGPDGTREAANRLKVSRAVPGYTMRVWIFCPRGLEGPQGSGWNRETLEFMIRTSDAGTNTGGTFGGGLSLDPGYTLLESPLAPATRPGQRRVTTEILRNFAVIARNEFIATFSE